MDICCISTHLLVYTHASVFANEWVRKIVGWVSVRVCVRVRACACVRARARVWYLEKIVLSLLRGDTIFSKGFLDGGKF